MKYTLLVILLLIKSQLSSQGLVVNEISNGTSGTKEFIELLVIGSTSQPTGVIDISGWIIDDNNGDFEALSGAGVAAGHYRFVSYPPVKIGSLIIIYNHDDRNDNMIPDDELDSDNDFVYVLPINSRYLERCTSLPSSTNGSLYSPCTYSSLPTQTWTSIGLRNGGDATQVRKPDYSFYHGFSYGDVLNPYPTFPIEFGGSSSFNVRTGSGTGHNYYLDCGDWTLQTNYQRGDANFDTPGLPNTGDNTTLVTRVRYGMFNYSNLGDLVNCQAIILNNDNLNFKAKIINNGVNIVWDLNNDYNKYILEKSNDGYNFYEIYSGSNNYFIDGLEPHNYYRLKLVEYNDEFTYTNTIYVEGEKDVILTIYPNPTQDFINIKTNLENINYQLYTISGQKKLCGRVRDNILDIRNLPKGLYYIFLETKESFHSFKIQKT